MRKAKKVVEAVKTALIVLLAASALILGWRTGLFNDLFRTVPFFGSVAELMWGAAASTEADGISLKEAALPLYIVVTDAAGGHYGVKYDTDMRSAVYDRTSSILNEALGSASEPREISEAEWREALLGPGVFFSYMKPVKLSVLEGWLKTRAPLFPQDVSVRNIFVAFGKDRSKVFLQDHESGLIYGADTASSAEKAQELEIYSANDAMFAFETNIKASENAPYALILNGNEHPDIHAGPSGSSEEVLNAALEALGHTDEVYAIQPEGDGALRCVGTQFNISVDSRGCVTYRRTESLPPVEERPTLSEGEMIETARVIIENTVGAMCGNAEVFFESFEYNAGYFSVCFGYSIAGGRVYLHDDVNAARVNFLSGIVRNIELNFRNYSYTGEYTRLLPERQALAAAGGEFTLCYSDTGAESMQPYWT